MADRTVELYAALYTALSGAAGLTSALGGSGKVYEGKAPDNAAVPYVVIGDATAVDAGASLRDSQEHTVTIHVWTVEPGKLQLLNIMAAVRAVLHDADLALSGGALANLRQEFSNTTGDPDGVSQHGVMRYRAVTTD